MASDNQERRDEGQNLEVLDRVTCIELLSRHGFVGRLAIVADGRPAIFPVNYIVDDGSIVFCTASGTKLSALVEDTEVAFEVDDSAPLHHSGWSVVVRGRAAVITDPRDLGRLSRGPLHPWAKGARANWVRIGLEDISGRRIPEI
jgi:nitroimidazol reductase NimA-like FMN-containing flavoprotein (pyridoxamine 5'-phosphate oxidase superfamily)